MTRMIQFHVANSSKTIAFNPDAISKVGEAVGNKGAFIICVDGGYTEVAEAPDAVIAAIEGRP